MASFCGLLFLAFASFLLFNFYFSLFGGSSSYLSRVRECTQHNIVVCIINPGNKLTNETSITDISNSTDIRYSNYTSEIISADNAVTPENEKLPNNLDELKIVPDRNMTLLKKLIEKIYPRFGRAQAAQTTLEQQTASNLNAD